MLKIADVPVTKPQDSQVRFSSVTLREVFVSQERVSGFPEKEADLGEVWGTSGEVNGIFSSQEGVNSEKLTVEEIHINNEMFFFHRLCPL